DLANDPRVSGAGYVTAFWPQPGQSFVDAAGGQLARWIEVDEAMGLSRIADAAVPKVLPAGFAETAAGGATTSLGAQSLLSFTEPSEHSAWGDNPVTYIVCTEDRVVPESAQRQMASNEPHTVIAEVAAGHFVMLTAPDVTAQAITDAAGRIIG
ncbi:MAG: alpha/beta hydrolase, partial [Leucobacter sp.]|nr:alpha/beta hydrolase [Leucobacter sp.]